MLLTCTVLLSSAYTLSPPPTPPPIHSSWMQEAEKKHGRVAMLALPALAAISMANGGVDPVPWLNAQPVSTQLVFYSVASALETVNLKRLDAGFKLKDGEVPGQLWKVSFPPELGVLEDVTGRAAMIGAASVMLDSVLTF